LRFALAVEAEVDGDAGFFGVPRNSGLPGFHAAIKTEPGSEDKAQSYRTSLLVGDDEVANFFSRASICR
jgi:hypothetical protein